MQQQAKGHNEACYTPEETARPRSWPYILAALMEPETTLTRNKKEVGISCFFKNKILYILYPVLTSSR